MATDQTITEKSPTPQDLNPSQRQFIEKSEGEPPDTYVVIPPDGGWGWIVVIGAFFSFLVSDGVIYAFGILLDNMADTFNCSNSQVALTGAIMTGFFCLCGPFVSALVNRFGYRAVAVSGSLVACISCILTSLSSSLYVTFFTHGVMGGIGYGLIYVPAVIAVGFYFERWRALATGIAVCGAGIGGITLPPILTLLVKQVGWRSTFQILAGLSFGCTLCGFLYRPLKPVLLRGVHGEERANEHGSTILEDKRSFFTRFHNTSFPTISDVHCKSHPTIIDINVKPYTTNTDIETTSTVTIYKPQKLDRYSPSECSMLSLQSHSNVSCKSSFRNVKSCKTETSTRNADSKLSTVYEEEKVDDRCCVCDHWWCKKNRKAKSTHAHKYGTYFKVLGSHLACNICCKIVSNSGNESVITRPLYRDDIFYSASLMFLPEYRKSMYISHGTIPSSSAGLKSKLDMEYSMLVTRTITEKEMTETKTCPLCSESIKRTLATMLDFNLLKSPSFLLLSFSAVFTSLGFYTPYMFVKDRAIQYGVLPEQSAFWLISCIGCTNTLGRIACGVITSFSKICTLKICYVSLFVGGFATALSGLSYNMWIQFGYAAVYGVSVACMSTLRTIIMVDLLGLEKLTNAIGIILMFQGVAALMGTSVSGFLRDLTGDYQVSFYFAGGCLCMGALLLVPIKEVSAWEKRRR